MMTRTIDDSQRRAATVAGLAGLITMAIVVVANLGIHGRLIVADNVAETGRRIMAHERLFRIGIVCDLIYSAGLVVLLTALYGILRPVSRGVAMLAAFFRLVYALMWVVIALNLLTALRLLSGGDFQQVFGSERVQRLAKLSLSGLDTYYVGLLFYALASTLCGYLWFKSNYIPRPLAAWGVISSGWCAACTVAFLIVPSFARVVNLWWFDTPMVIFEMVASVWLLVRGLPTA